MAERSEGGSKLSDFFVGVIDLFAILLPGAILTFVAQKVLEKGWPCKLDEYLPHGEAARWAVFLVISYVLGHFIFAVGSFLLDDLYDQTYKEWWWKRKGVKELKEIAAKVLEEQFAPLQTRLNNRAKKEAQENLQTQENSQKKETQEKHCVVNSRVIEWSDVICRFRSSAASTEIDRAQADSKFFRGLVALQLVGWPVILLFRQGFDTCFLREYVLVILLLLAYRLQKVKWVKGTVGNWLFNGCTMVLAVLAVILSIRISKAIAPVAFDRYVQITVISLLLLSLWRFMQQRLKATRLTYEFFIALSEIKSPVELGQPETPRPPAGTTRQQPT